MTLDPALRAVSEPSVDARASDASAPSDPPPVSIWKDGPASVLRLPDAPFEGVRAALREHLPHLAGELAGRSVRVDLGARDVALLDLRRTITLLRQEFSIEATGIYLRREVLWRFAERELKLKVFANDPPEPPAAPSVPPVPEPEPELEAVVAEPAPAEPAPADPAPAEPAAVEVAPPAPEPAPEAPAEPAARKAATPTPAPARDEPRQEGRRAQTIQRTLRSGTILRFDGDLYVMGDVNPGAQVIATGNIVVLGALKGTAHAGSAGDESATILAFDLRPMQLRIARLIAIPPDRKSDTELNPEIARIEGDQVKIESYRGRPR